MEIEDIGDTLIDGIPNNQTGITLLDTSDDIDPIWLKFSVASWKNEAEFDVYMFQVSLLKYRT